MSACVRVRLPCLALLLVVGLAACKDDSDGAHEENGSAFISVWHTGPDAELRLPLNWHGTYDFVVDWGDGARETIRNYDSEPGEPIHRYEAPGEYSVTIVGEFEGWTLRKKDAEKLLRIEQWGDLRLGDFGNFFDGAKNLEITATDVPDLSATTTLRAAFRECESLTTIPSMNEWDVSSVEDMAGMFERATRFNEDIGAWDVSSVENMRGMFSHAKAFNQDIGGWDVSSVETMSVMFNGTESFNRDIGAWDVSSVENMELMFNKAERFDQDIGGWDVSSLKNASSMFARTDSFDQDIGGWDVSSVENMHGMFAGATRFDQDIGRWDVSSVENMEGMFATTHSFNQDLGSWDVSAAKRMRAMFRRAKSFNQDLSAWDVTSDHDTTDMFKDAKSFDQDVSAWGWETSPEELGLEPDR